MFLTSDMVDDTMYVSDNPRKIMRYNLSNIHRGSYVEEIKYYNVYMVPSKKYSSLFNLNIVFDYVHDISGETSYFRRIGKGLAYLIVLDDVDKIKEKVTRWFIPQVHVIPIQLIPGDVKSAAMMKLIL